MNPQVLSSIDQFVAPESTQLTQKDTDRRHTSTTGVHGSWGIGEQGREREKKTCCFLLIREMTINQLMRNVITAEQHFDTHCPTHTPALTNTTIQLMKANIS